MLKTLTLDIRSVRGISGFTLIKSFSPRLAKQEGGLLVLCIVPMPV